MSEPHIITPRDHAAVKRRGLHAPPTTPDELHAWLRYVLDIDVPRCALLGGSSAPFDYLAHAFFEEGPPDCIVWACRGGGKTFYAAVATLLDLLFKPGIEVKVLGGSLDQSRRMHEHLRKLFERLSRSAQSQLIDGKFGKRSCRLRNGSCIEVLAQSHTSVRGARPQKLRCDEVELFDPEVWRAAQLVTRSKVCGGGQRIMVRGSVEALSTMHRVGGLMSELVAESGRVSGLGFRGSGEAIGSGITRSQNPAAPSRQLFRWGVIDVLEECPASRPCEGCPLFDECGGRAKPRGAAGSCRGHIGIEDAIALKRRSDRASWESEMLCIRPFASNAVFPEFDRALHIADHAGAVDASPLMCGIDFGFRAPTVILWAQVDVSGVLRIIAERSAAEVLMARHIEAVLAGDPGLGITAASGCEASRRLSLPIWVGVDPAGFQRSEQTGDGPAHALRKAGLAVRARRSSLHEGLRLIRQRLAPASGPPMILIDRQCHHLIASLESYRWPDDPRQDHPKKDGPDHAVDALRYLLINLERPSGAGVTVDQYA